MERASHVVDREPLEHEAASARAKPAQKRLGVPELPHCGAAATTTESVGARELYERVGGFKQTRSSSIARGCRVRQGFEAGRLPVGGARGSQRLACRRSALFEAESQARLNARKDFVKRLILRLPFSAALNARYDWFDPPHRPAQVIVCDDGPTDGIDAAVESYGDRLIYLRKEHGGVASAWNAAREVAVGEFFAVLGADDVYEPERLEALMELALAPPDLDILCTDVFFERHGDVGGPIQLPLPLEVINKKAAILERCFCIAPAVRREALRAVGGFDESLRTGSDWECAIRLIH